jgi:uncharacterized protein (TIGR03086 family)
MTEPPSPDPFGDAVALLERATSYALGTAAAVTDSMLDRATPCADWDLRALLDHINDSLAVVAELLTPTRASRAPGCAGDATGPVAVLRSRAQWLVKTCREHPSRVCIDGWFLDGRIAASTGALEIAVHGWDIAQSCGHDSPIPEGLAEALLRLAPLLITDAIRPALFAPAVPWLRQAEPGERLVAYLGRDPRP